MAQNFLYRITSIGRPLDPHYPTNRAVQRLMPTAAVVAAVVAGLDGGGPGSIARAAFGGLLVVFVSWALARELVPDDNPGAFISMALAFLAFVLVDDCHLLLPVVALFLVRIVNRGTGLKARLGDSILVLALVIWAILDLHAPLLGLVAALAFVADVLLREGLRRQWLFVGLCGVAAGISLLLDPQADIRLPDPGPILGSLLALCSLAWILSIATTRSVAAVGDIGGETLSIDRVRTGMAVALLIALQALTTTDPGVSSSALLWATLAGLLGGRIVASRRRGGTGSS